VKTKLLCGSKNSGRNTKQSGVKNRNGALFYSVNLQREKQELKTNFNRRIGTPENEPTRREFNFGSVERQSETQEKETECPDL